MPTMGNFAMGRGGWFGIGFAVITIVPMVIGILVKSFTGVKEGEMGIRVFFDVPRKNRDGSWKYLKPGAHLVIPGFHGIRTINVQDRVEELEPFMVDVWGEYGLLEQHEVKASLAYSVTKSTEGDALKNAIFQTQDLGKVARGESAAALRDILDKRDAANLNDAHAALRMLQYKKGQSMAALGVNLIAVLMTSTSISHSQMLRVGMRESGASTDKIAAHIDAHANRN